VVRVSGYRYSGRESTPGPSRQKLGTRGATLYGRMVTKTVIMLMIIRDILS